MSTYQWTDEKAAECERATRTVLDQPGVAISLVADVPADHQWWNGDLATWIDEPPTTVMDNWWTVIHRPKAGA